MSSCERREGRMSARLNPVVARPLQGWLSAHKCCSVRSDHVQVCKNVLKKLVFMSAGLN